MSTIIGLCVGHSRKIGTRIEGGAVAVDGKTNEWAYNRTLARHIAAHLKSHRVASLTVDHYEGAGYGSAQRWLASHLKAAGVTLALELHFNSASPTANGHEWLYWHSSTNGKRLASELNQNMCFGITQIKSRGIKAKTSVDRGAEFLSGTHCPAVICEPFFGSHAGDWQIAAENSSRIGRAIAEGILDYLL